MEFLTYPLAFLFLLGVLITVHELGHFIAARLAGVRVLRFSIGFGPSICSFTGRRGTEFRLALLPLGGFVEMQGEEVGEKDDMQDYSHGIALQQATLLWKLIITLAGPAANFLLAVIIYTIIFVVGSEELSPVSEGAKQGSALFEQGERSPFLLEEVDGEKVVGWQDALFLLGDRLGESGLISLGIFDFQTGEKRTISVPIEEWLVTESQPDILKSLGLVPTILSVVGGVESGSPAEKADLARGDLILSIDGEGVANWRELVEEIKKRPGQASQVEYIRDGEVFSRIVVPTRLEGANGLDIGRLGVSPLSEIVSYGVLESLMKGFGETGAKMLMTISMITKMIQGLISADTLVGPVGIAQIAGDTAKSSLFSFVQLMALLSISLGIINLLPIPMLDGGQVIMHTLESIKGSALPDGVLQLSFRISILLVATIFIFVTYNDLIRLFGGVFAP